MADYIIKPDNKKTVVGIDVGGSTTKIVGFAPGGKLLSPIFVQATDPVTSIYGAFGRFTLENGLSLDEIPSITASARAFLNLQARASADFIFRGSTRRSLSASARAPRSFTQSEQKTAR